MCPLRVILIFLSAAVAGFLVLRSLKEPPEFADDLTEDSATEEQQQLSFLAKIHSAISWGIWTCVDMASGRYLWRIILDPAMATAEKNNNKN